MCFRISTKRTTTEEAERTARKGDTHTKKARATSLNLFLSVRSRRAASSASIASRAYDLQQVSYIFKFRL